MAFDLEFQSVIVGAPGESAYQVAVDNGYVGTESQWLLSLNGQPGAQGPTGPAGPSSGGVFSPPRMVACFGDSRSYFNWNVDDGVTTPSTGARSPMWWMQTLSGGRLQTDYKYNFGQKGWSTWDVYNQLLNNNPNASGIQPSDTSYTFAVILIGTNDVSNLADFETMKTQLQYVIDKLRTYNKKICIIAEWPRGSTATPSSLLPVASQKLMQRWVNYLKSLRADTTLTVVDVWPRAADPAVVTAAAILNMLASDDLHNSPGIAYLQGSGMARELTKYMPPANFPPTSNGDVYDAAANPGGCLNTNPMLRGSGGTLGAGATGVVPDGCTLLATSGLAVVGSKFNLADGRTAYRMVVSGTPSTNHAAAILRVDALQTKVAAGDILQAGYEVQVSAAHQNFAAPTVKIDTGAALTSVYGGVSLDIDRTMPAQAVEAFSGVPLTPEYTVPSSVPASLAVEFRPMFTSGGVASSLTIDIISCFIKKRVVDGTDPTAVSVTPSTFTIAQGGSQAITAVVAPAGAPQSVSYSYDTAVFSLSGNIFTRIGGVDGNNSVITVSTPNSKTAVATATLASASTPAALTNAFSRLVMAGSSDEVNAFYERDQLSAMARRLRTKHGIAKTTGAPVDTLLQAYGGDYQSDWENRYYSTLVAQLSATDMVYFGSTLARDVSNTYASKNSGSASNAWTGTAGDLALKAAHKRLMLGLAATGAVVFPQTLKFNNFGSRTEAAEDAGSKGFNDNAVRPNIKEMSPPMAVGDSLYFDVYPTTASLYSPGYADTENLSVLGLAPLRNFIMDNLNARIKGLAPISVTKLFEAPAVPSPCRVFGIDGGDFNVMSPLMYNSAMYQYSPPVAASIPSLEGYRLNSIKVTGYAINQLNNGSSANTGNTNDSLLNDQIKKMAFYVESGQGIKKYADIMGLNANQQFEFRYVSCYSVSAADPARIIQVSGDNFVTVAGENNGAVIAGQEPSIAVVTLTADASGNCSIYLRAKVGSSAGYLNGYEIWPL